MLGSTGPASSDIHEGNAKLTSPTPASVTDGTRATFAYDSDGNRILSENVSISATFVYDALNRVQSTTTDMGTKKTIQYAYDAAGNRSNMIDPDGGRFTYLYNAANQISSLRNPQGDRTTFAYDAAGQRTVKKLANGTRASFSYDAAGNTTRVANLKSDGTTISSFDYRFDADNRQTSITEADGSRVTYLYDAASRFTGEHRTGTTPYRNTFTYDSADNRILKNESGSRTTYAYDAANQLTTSIDSSGTTTYTFDANGNQQLVVAPGNNRTTTTWDYENRTSTIILPSSIRNTMLYNPDGLRVEFQESAGTKRFIWDGQAYLVETDSSNVIEVVYTNEPTRFGHLVSQYRTAGSISDSSYYHFDALGSTSHLTNTLENTTDTYTYNAWGEVILSVGNTPHVFQWIGIAGYWYSAFLGQYYIRSRHLIPPIARWSATDPVPSNIANSQYAYANNSPTLMIDPTGEINVMVCCYAPYSCYCGGAFLFMEDIFEVHACTFTDNRKTRLPNGVEVPIGMYSDAHKCCLSELNKKKNPEWVPESHKHLKYIRCSRHTELISEFFGGCPGQSHVQVA